MKPRAVFFIFLLPLLIISCKKETFPDNEDLKGEWVEITSLLDRENLSFDGVKTLFYTTRALRCVQTDTLIYGLDKIHEKLYLYPKDSPNSESVHKILLNPETGELTIWGLHQFEPEAKFKKQ